MKLNIKAFALTTGIFWGVGLFFITWFIILFSGPVEGPILVDYVYLGYSVSPIGSIIGMAWAFVDGIVGGAIFGWLYNQFVSRFPMSKNVVH